LGQNVNSYRDGETDFPALLDAVASISGNFRLRFMTSHPKDFSAKLVAVMKKHAKICKCLHLPAQSGSNRILSLMNRRYTREKYLEDVALLKREIPDCELTTDLIVGFPTETEEEFCETLSLVKEAGFSSAFTFIYSPRTGTKAAEMEGRISDEVSKDRITRLIALVNSQTREKSALCVGHTVEILCEDYDEKKKMYMGRDEHGRMGYFQSEGNPVGEFVKLHITKANGISLYGVRAEGNE
ncbi:MAG: MiaB/RimO family radical SAM methylthiotransferase, partial [Clostridia bacterium]|nr:MiaB/RimO family radical SAM methylthiotransferase [Clostridia bacterium]